MYSSRLRAEMLCLLLFPATARADVSEGLVSGLAPDGTPVAASVSTEFVPTGGDYDAGQGTGLLRITLVNQSGALPYANPKRGNPVATEVAFNLKGGARAFLMRATVPADGIICQLGAVSYPSIGATSVLAAPMDVTSLYQLRTNPLPTGYTHTIASVGGTRGGVVDVRMFQGLDRRGDVYSPLVFAGAVEFELWITGLDHSQESAADFVAGCALATIGNVPGAVAVKYQGIGVAGAYSTTAANPCATTPVIPSTWGAIKSLYR